MNQIQKLQSKITYESIRLQFAKTEKKRLQIQNIIQKVEKRLVKAQYKADKKQYLNSLIGVKQMFTRAEKAYDKTNTKKRPAIKKVRFSRKVQVVEVELYDHENVETFTDVQIVELECYEPVQTHTELLEDIVSLMQSYDLSELPKLRRELARQYHPDKNPNSVEIMMIINSVYDKIVNQVQEYDVIITQPTNDWKYDDLGVPVETFSDYSDSDYSDSEISDIDQDFDNMPITEEIQPVFSQIQTNAEQQHYCNYIDMDCDGLSQMFQENQIEYFPELGFVENLNEVYTVVSHNLDQVSRRVVSRYLNNPISIEIMQQYWLEHVEEIHKKQIEEHRKRTFVKCNHCKEQIRMCFAICCPAEKHWRCTDAIALIDGQVQYSYTCKNKYAHNFGFLSGCWLCDKQLIESLPTYTTELSDYTTELTDLQSKQIKRRKTKNSRPQIEEFQYIVVTEGPQITEEERFRQKMLQDMCDYEEIMREQRMLEEMENDNSEWERFEFQ